jgi:TonB-dependent Receptor Plug Domain.
MHCRILQACLLLCCLGTALADNSREIISAAEIEREKPASLMELLRKRGGLGDSSGALSLRGVPKIALYVDGFSRGGAVTELEKIKPQDVASIEIIRGAASNRYGAMRWAGRSSSPRYRPSRNGSWGWCKATTA